MKKRKIILGIVIISLIIGLVLFFNKSNEVNILKKPAETEEHIFYRTALKSNYLLEVSFRENQPLSYKDTSSIQQFLNKYYYNKDIKLSDYSSSKLKIIQNIRNQRLQESLYFKQDTDITLSQPNKVDALDFNTRNIDLLHKYFSDNNEYDLFNQFSYQQYQNNKLTLLLKSN